MILKVFLLLFASLLKLKDLPNSKDAFEYHVKKKRWTPNMIKKEYIFEVEQQWVVIVNIFLVIHTSRARGV